MISRLRKGVTLGNSSGKAKKKYTRDPDCLQLALDTTACMNFANANNLHRRSRGLPSLPNSHSANPSTRHRSVFLSCVMRALLYFTLLLCSGFLCFGQTAASSPSPGGPGTVSDMQEKLQHGQPQRAIADLQQLAAKQPPVPGASRALGIAYYRTGKLIDAEQAFAKAMTQDPSDVESVQLRGLTLYRLGRPAEAIPFLERVRQWTPNANADANHVLGLCYMNARRYDDARGAFAAQYHVPADSAPAYLLTGSMLMQADLPELAAQDAHKALEISPQLPLAHFMLGEVYLYKSDVAHALEEFEQERAINPASPAVYDRLGDVYTRTGQYQQAEEALTRAISLDVSSTGPFIQMGKVFLRRNDPQSAAMYLQHAEKMDPGNYITHTLLGQAYRGLGKEEEAKRELDMASQIHATSQLKLQPVQ
jgi:tetratricopeptide (TPR) repeat protein